MTTDVLLVGSVPLETTEQVMRTACAGLGDLISRVPDGEVGVRGDFIGWQADLLLEHPQFEPSGEVGRYNPKPRSQLRAGVAPDQIVFDDLGYASAALDSHRVFAELKRRGEIPAHVRLQVCLPSPMAPVTAWISDSDQEAVRPAYVSRMLAEIDEIAAAVPHEELSIQWDITTELARMERAPSAQARAELADRFAADLAAVHNHVPSDVGLGTHLCYGDFNHRHAIEPADTGVMVELRNALHSRLTRPADYVHMPVPRDHYDAEYFAPLKDHQLGETRLYLGLVHFTDGLDGARRRIEAAGTQVDGFGIATECGWGRRDPATIPGLIELHREVAAAMDATMAA